MATRARSLVAAAACGSLSLTAAFISREAAGRATGMIRPASCEGGDPAGSEPEPGGGGDGASNARLCASVAAVRANEDAMRLRWIRDEDHWRKLPARAWPAHQPDADQEQELRCQADTKCRSGAAPSEACMRARFDLATCLLFNSVDPPGAFELYDANARAVGTGPGTCHDDSTTMAGTCMMEGLHGTFDDEKGSSYLRRSAANGHAQGIYELACLYHSGLAEPHVEPNCKTAFELFESAAAMGHTCAQYLLADLLIEAPDDCCDRDFARAVDLLYTAGEKGHRTARAELLAILDDQHKLVKLVKL